MVQYGGGNVEVVYVSVRIAGLLPSAKQSVKKKLGRLLTGSRQLKDHSLHWLRVAPENL
jgi:hypothetical protein